LDIIPHNYKIEMIKLKWQLYYRKKLPINLYQTRPAFGTMCHSMRMKHILKKIQSGVTHIK
ncbi:MAG: hypothetical protein ACK55Z_01150, partial [bacterium]